MPRVLDHVKNMLKSKDFQSRHKESPRDFTRKSKLPFETMISFFLNLNKGSYNTELKELHKAKSGDIVGINHAHKSAISKARKKLKPSAFVELNDELISYSEAMLPLEKWHGFRLLGIDGSTSNIPNEKEIVDHFGAWHPPHAKEPCPKARVSQMYDVLNQLSVDAIIAPKSKGERELAEQHLLKSMAGDLLLLDRGYESIFLFFLILSVGADFCSRIKISGSNQAKTFMRSGKDEQIIAINLPPKWHERAQEAGIEVNPVKLRYVRVDLPTGETELLITSLLDKEKYPHHLFKGLYHQRWAIEEDYKVLKKRAQIECFSGKTVRSVYQDFHAKVLSKNITATLINSLKPVVFRTAPIYKVNFTQALAAMKNSIVAIIESQYEKAAKITNQLLKAFFMCLEAVRPGRSFPRNPRNLRGKFYFEYKAPA